MTIKNVSANFINLFGLITADKLAKSDPTIGNYSETGIDAGNTIDLLLTNTPGRIYESFELWRRIAAAEIVTICGATQQTPADSLKHFQFLGIQCFLDTQAILPVPIPDPFIWGNSEFAVGKIFSDTIIANTNDYTNPAIQTAVIAKLLIIGGNRQITGIIAPAAGRYKILIVMNTSLAPRTLSLRNNDPASAAANRFLFNGNITVQPNEAASLFYDQVINRWRCYSKNN